MKIGQKIKYYREIRGLTQDKLAKDICSVSYLSKIENTVTEASDEIINLLAKKLQISTEWDEQEKLEITKEMLREWYEIIIDRDKEESSTCGKVIKEFIDDIEDPSINNQYLLFSLRCKLLLNDMRESNTIIEHLKTIQNTFSSEENYYFNYFYGIFKYLQNNYLESLKYYFQVKSEEEQINKNEPQLLYFIALSYSKLYNTSLAIYY